MYHEYRFDVCMLGFVLPPRAELLVLRCELGNHHALLLLVHLGWFFGLINRERSRSTYVTLADYIPCCPGRAAFSPRRCIYSSALSCARPHHVCLSSSPPFVYALAGCCFDPPVVCFRFAADRVHKTRCSRPDGTISVLTKGDSNKVRAQR